MSPLQAFVLRECAPSGSVQLIDLVRIYLDELDGTEAAEWRDQSHIISVLSRSFTIKRGLDNIRRIVGLSFKPTPKLGTLVEGVLNVASI